MSVCTLCAFLTKQLDQNLYISFPAILYEILYKDVFDMECAKRHAMEMMYNKNGARIRKESDSDHEHTDHR